MAATTVRQWLSSRARLAGVVCLLAGTATLVAAGRLHGAGVSDLFAIPAVIVGFALVYAPMQARVACPACGHAFWRGSWRFGEPSRRLSSCPQCGIDLDGPLP